MLEIMKLLLGLDKSDLSQDNILNHFIDQALMVAYAYSNVAALPTQYYGTIVDLAVYLYLNRDSVGYSRKVQGERSVTFEDGWIPEYIKSALPLPKIKVGCE
jgi:hypothetical protein